ncbi:MAG TPA: MBL fold metallo-hydrolase [Chryseolinea sp.]|nr:MBL fold metallo-hydrolase [Chryseolinea sp.]
MFNLRVVQAKFGDCLIVEYGSKDHKKHMLIDGGPAGVYDESLRAELAKIKDEGGQIDLMVLSHIDGDHIVGLIDLLEELKQNAADDGEPLIKVNELWINSFSQTISRGNNLTKALQNMFRNVNNLASTMPSGNLALQSVKQGDALRRNAKLLSIPINKFCNEDIISCETISGCVTVDNLKLTIVGPNKDNLEKLQKEWTAWIKKNETKVLSADPDVLSQLDKSVPNLSSIMFLMESEGKTILFTGDGRGDFILEGLEKANLLDENGVLHVDVFKVPHHGSVRNSTEDFFDKVQADTYVISADGRHDNPDFETLSWIVTSTHKQRRRIKLLCTNETPSSKKLLKKFPPEEYGYELEYLPKTNTSIALSFSA